MKQVFYNISILSHIIIEDTFYRRVYRIQDLLPEHFQQIYYNDVSSHFYAYDM